MSQVKFTLQKNNAWDQNRRYKINDVVIYSGANYQNETGLNSTPGVGTDWKLLPINTIANNLTEIVSGKALDATQGKILKDLVDTKLVTQSNTIFVQSLADLPTPSSSVITLAANTSYIFTKTVDLLGNSLFANDNCEIVGVSNLSCGIISTGLSISNYLITSTRRISLSNITLEHNRILSRSSVSIGDFVNIFRCRINNALQTALINNAQTVSIRFCIFTNSDKLQIQGVSDTIVIDNCAFSSSVSSLAIIDSSAITINKRYRISYCRIENNAASDSLNILLTNIPDESLIIDTVDFSGPLVFPYHNSNKTLIVNCKGITNTTTIGFLSMINNATATTNTVNVWTKVLGTTTAGSINSKYTHANNRLTYTGAFSINQIVKVNLNLFAANNNQTISIGIAKNGTIVAESEITARYIDGSNPIPCSLAIPIALTTNDYVEVFARNSTSGSNITVQYMQLLIIKIPV